MKFRRMLLNILIVLSLAAAYNLAIIFMESGAGKSIVSRYFFNQSDGECEQEGIYMPDYMDGEYYFHRVTRKSHETDSSFITRARNEAKDYRKKDKLYVCEAFELKCYHQLILKCTHDKTKAIPDSEIRLR